MVFKLLPPKASVESLLLDLEKHCKGFWGTILGLWWVTASLPCKLNNSLFPNMLQIFLPGLLFSF